jgi:hypothetical protein
MTERSRQRQLDLLAIRFVDALEASDFETINRLWAAAAKDPELEAVFIETAAALAETHEAEARTRIAQAVTETVERHLPSAELIWPHGGPLTVAEVAEFIRRHPPAGLTTDEIAVNELLRHCQEEIPTELGMSQVLDWGRKFGTLPEMYWRIFRQSALKLRMRREADTNYQMAARKSTRKHPEKDS